MTPRPAGRLSPALWFCATAAVAASCTAGPGELIHDDHQGPGGDGGVGAACTADPDCRLDLVCATDMPGGMCSRICGVDDPCPDGANCIRVLVEERAYAVCLPACRYDAQCRQQDGYFCLQLQDSLVRVCWF